GDVRARVIPNRTRATLVPFVKEHVASGGTVYTDKHHAYRDLAGEGYVHEAIDHAAAYVEGKVHTNGMENFWSLLKRGLAGTYVSVDPFHLFRYLDEQVFRFNNRKTKERNLT